MLSRTYFLNICSDGRFPYSKSKIEIFFLESKKIEI